MVISNYDEKMVVEHDGNHLLLKCPSPLDTTVVLRFAESMMNTEFQMEYYYPYFHGTDVSNEEVALLKSMPGKESFAGACDDVRIGVTPIFIC